MWTKNNIPPDVLEFCDKWNITTTKELSDIEIPIDLDTAWLTVDITGDLIADMLPDQGLISLLCSRERVISFERHYSISPEQVSLLLLNYHWIKVDAKIDWLS